MDGNNITRFPVIARPRPRAAAVIPIRDAGDVPDAQRQQDISVVRRDLDHALRKAVTVTEYHGELAWLVRFLEAEIAKIKDAIGSKVDG